MNGEKQLRVEFASLLAKPKGFLQRNAGLCQA